MKKILCAVLILLLAATAVFAFRYFYAVRPIRSLQEDIENARTVELRGKYTVSDATGRRIGVSFRGRRCQGDTYLEFMDVQGNPLANFYEVPDGIRWDLKPMISYLIGRYNIPEKITDPILGPAGLGSLIASQEQLDFLLSRLGDIEQIPEILLTSPGVLRSRMSSLLSARLVPCRKPAIFREDPDMEGYHFGRVKGASGQTVGIRVREEGGFSLVYLSESSEGMSLVKLECSLSQTLQPVESPKMLLSQKNFDLLRSVVEWIEESVQLVTELIAHLSV